jgi:hypothetical protein
MTGQIERRLAALEASQGVESVPRLTIIRRLIPCRDGGISRLCSGDERWTRQPSETERAFIDRASHEVKRNQFGAARLIAE